ncbi:hypothetical protein [Streptomyces fagopyri]|uniref:hypothetical protein n=1 Tax=Streptomyces fagopyri TaxID=2662397 RepID=UPI00381D7EFA
MTARTAHLVVKVGSGIARATESPSGTRDTKRLRLDPASDPGRLLPALKAERPTGLPGVRA